MFLITFNLMTVLIYMDPFETIDNIYGYNNNIIFIHLTHSPLVPNQAKALLWQIDRWTNINSNTRCGLTAGYDLFQATCRWTMLYSNVQFVVHIYKIRINLILSTYTHIHRDVTYITLTYIHKKHSTRLQILYRPSRKTLRRFG